MTDDSTKNLGRIHGVNGNLITVVFENPVRQNEVGYARLGELLLKAEIVRVRAGKCWLQVFEDTVGLKVGDPVEFSGDLLSVELGPGLLKSIYDGLQNPLPELAEQAGFFLERGQYIDGLNRNTQWDFTPSVQVGDLLKAGDAVGSVPEGMFTHRIMIPFGWKGQFTVKEISEACTCTVEKVVAKVEDSEGELREVKLYQNWPVKKAITAFEERLRPTENMSTQVRIIDTFFPVARGGTYCIPGPFGAGKTVLQQITSRRADVDIVIIAACGERAGEVVETLREFPELEDPRTGRSLMERTLIICNTSSMPVASREASVYTGVTLAEYYRQMGLNVLMLADSTSRWAQALRELSGRLEEIPGEEAFPAYLESVIASFYERAGVVRLNDGSTGSVTVGGTVSPAGGNFEEPVTQSTLKVVGAFHGLSRERSDQRRYPAIDPMDSWSKYPSLVDEQMLKEARTMLRDGRDVENMMKVVGEEGTALEDFILFLKAEFLDEVYLQQDAYHDVDGASSAERQQHVFGIIHSIMSSDFSFPGKDQARQEFQRWQQMSKDWNRTPMDSPEFATAEAKLMDAVNAYRSGSGKEN